jgi:DNA (cytosine-5)-methyltransferase 1
MLTEGLETHVSDVVSAETESIETISGTRRPQPGPLTEGRPPVAELTCLEICAGGGGQSLGLEQAGFAHAAAVEIDPDACATLRLNRSEWNIVERDIHQFEATEFSGIDLLAGGVPCPPFSIAGKQLGADDERDLFPRALHLIEQCEPTAIMLENVRGLSAARFAGYREQVLARLHELDYETTWEVLNACDFGVPQLRPRFILVAMRASAFKHFKWPEVVDMPPTVGEALHGYMAADGWPGARVWAAKANGIGPTLVGGSRKHGGPDLGPTRARNDWLKLHVDGRGLANEPPASTDPVDHLPRLTLPMAAAVQGFPASWRFAGRKTAQYRQIGNAFPPPVARAVGTSIRSAIAQAREGLTVGSDRPRAAPTQTARAQLV